MPSWSRRTRASVRTVNADSWTTPVPCPRRWWAIALAGCGLVCAEARADAVRRPATVLDLTAAPPVIALTAQDTTKTFALALVGGPTVEATPFGAVIAEAARRTGVPADFLLGLLRQESGLNPQAVSRKGALGIAQFMPATAAERGLDNPFDPERAIHKAAELLQDLRKRYGNWGLAAAAYNAGPGRIDAWLLGRGELPPETVAYVAKITGVNAREWAAASRWSGPGRPSYILLASMGLDGIAAASAPNLRPGPDGLDVRPPSARRGRPPALGEPVRSTARLPPRSAPRPPAGPSGSMGPCAALLSEAAPCLVYRHY